MTANKNIFKAVIIVNTLPATALATKTIQCALGTENVSIPTFVTVTLGTLDKTVNYGHVETLLVNVSSFWIH